MFVDLNDPRPALAVAAALKLRAMEAIVSGNDYSATTTSTGLDETDDEFENHRSPRQLGGTIFGEVLTSNPTDGQSPMTQLTDSMRDFNW